MKHLAWQNIQKLGSHKFTCGYCGQPLASEYGWHAVRQENTVRGMVNVTYANVYVCHHCSRPTLFDKDTGKQTPGCAFGKPVQNVSDKSLADVYEEARTATSAGCYTAAVLCCRKLLMHLAVANGAKEGESFKSYVEFLAKNNHVPAACKSWVDQIRDTGNEANHEIKMMKKDDAEYLVSFCEMLLKITYEFPAVASARTAAKVTN
jgi:hypothetical protein